MKVAITYPPIISDKGVPLLSQNRQFQWFNRPTFIYPVVPATAATMAKNAGHDVLWLDGIAEELCPESFDNRLEEFKPDVIVIETKTPVVKTHWTCVNRLKILIPTAKIILVGDHVTAMPKESFEHSDVDVVLTGGDYDFLLVNYLAHLTGKSELEPGIWYRDGKEIKNTGQFVLHHDLKTLPWIDRDLTKWRLYSVKNGNFRKTPGTYVMSGRDCWHGKCTFCSWTTLYTNFRARDPVDVVSEIGNLIDKYGVREIMDDTGCFPAGGWLKTFCEEMIKRGYNKRVSIDCNMRFGRLSLEEYKLMKEAGFRLVLFGLESANQSTLDRLVKAVKVEQIVEGARDASKAGLDVHVTVMFGYPWEGKAEMCNTVNLARQLLIECVAYTLQVTIVIPYPGTPLFKQMDADDLLITRDWDEYDMRKSVMKCGTTEEEIKQAVRDVYRAFLHPKAIWNRLLKTKSLTDDLKFYGRGFLSVLGHLKDFK